MPNPLESARNPEQLEEQRSQTLKCAPPLIAKALQRIEEIAQVNRQTKWDNRHMRVIEDLRKLYQLLYQLGGWLKTEASVGTPIPVNEFLAREQIPLTLGDMRRDNDIYSAAVLKVLTEWAEKGKQAMVRLTNGKEVPAVSMVGETRMPNHILVYNLRKGLISKSPGLEDLAIRIATTTPVVDFVLLPKVFDDPYKNTQGLLQRLTKQTEQQKRDNSFRGVVFPMVDLRITEERINELIGATVMGGDGKPVIIAQAKGYMLLQMNEAATRAEATAALVGAITSISPIIKPVVVIDRPFTVILRVNDTPVMAVSVDYPNMKDPGNVGGLERGEIDPYIYSSNDMSSLLSSGRGNLRGF